MQLHSHERARSRNILFHPLSWPLSKSRCILRCKRTSFHEEYAFELSKLQFVSIADISSRAAVLLLSTLRLRKLEGCRAIITDDEIEKASFMMVHVIKYSLRHLSVRLK